MSEVPLYDGFTPLFIACREGRLQVPPAREFFIDNLLVRIHFIIVMIRWTALASPGPPSLDLSPQPQLIDSGLVGSTDFHSLHPQGHEPEQ